MKNRILRLALVVLAVAGQAAAGFFVFRWERAQVSAKSGVVTLTRDAARVQSMIGEIRGAQAGMVGFGQDPGYWVPKLAALVQDATARLNAIDAAGLVAEAAQDRAAAIEALAAFARTSDRVRDLLGNDQPLTASTLAFGQAAEHLSTASGALANVAPTQAAAVEQQVSRLRLLEVYALLGAAGFTLLVLLILLPRARMPESEPAAPRPRSAWACRFPHRPRRTSMRLARAGSTWTSRGSPGGRRAIRRPSSRTSPRWRSSTTFSASRSCGSTPRPRWTWPKRPGCAGTWRA